jgi:predicted ATP-grasp superfamily ATP-dependent carboligase
VLESDPSLPGNRTRCGVVRRVPGIHGETLIQVLQGLAAEFPAQHRPAVFLTNDRMTETVAANAAVLTTRYRISWLDAAPAVVELLTKSRLGERCRLTGLRYPRTVLLDEAEPDSGEQVTRLEFPVILKPVKPLAGFKTLVIHEPGGLPAALDRVRGSLPVIAQEFIAGDDTSIRFGAVCFDRGRPIARFEGRKLRSRPMGHTTVAVSARDDEVHALTLQFFQGLELSGPASLELKRDPEGRYWVIEPTVGRTDFWVDLCVANAVNLPFVEYRVAWRLPPPDSRQEDRYLWLNGERDPFALAWVAANHPSELRGRRTRGVYLSTSDPRPALAALSRSFIALPSRGLNRLRHLSAVATPPSR